MSHFHLIICPHIIYNAKTKKYVCWLKVMNGGETTDATQTETVLTADSILGPYTIVEEGLRPLGMNAGDFDLAVSPDDGKAYYYFERCHTETICADLTDDYTNVTGYYSTHFPCSGPPYTREATAHFMRKGKHYLVTSGTTGYLPNPSEVAIADTWHGPYKVLGNPHPGDETNTSYHSQITSVFKVPGKKDLYIALADRWMPEEMHRPYEAYRDMFAAWFHPDEFPDFDFDAVEEMPEGNTSIADYVWLPFRFDGEMAYLDWLDEWKWEDYE